MYTYFLICIQGTHRLAPICFEFPTRDDVLQHIQTEFRNESDYYYGETLIPYLQYELLDPSTPYYGVTSFELGGPDFPNNGVNWIEQNHAKKKAVKTATVVSADCVPLANVCLFSVNQT